MPSCPECESPISANEPFCPVCGIALGNAAQPEQVPEPKVEAAKEEPPAEDEFDGTLMMSPEELAALVANKVSAPKVEDKPVVPAPEPVIETPPEPEQTIDEILFGEGSSKSPGTSPAEAHTQSPAIAEQKKDTSGNIKVRSTADYTLEQQKTLETLEEQKPEVQSPALPEVFPNSSIVDDIPFEPAPELNPEIVPENLPSFLVDDPFVPPVDIPDDPAVISPSLFEDEPVPEIAKPGFDLPEYQQENPIYDSVRIVAPEPPDEQAFVATRIPSSRNLNEPRGSSPEEERPHTTPNFDAGTSSGKKSSKLKPLTEGAILNNRYEIIRKIGGGGMGAVYLASDNNLGGVLRAVKEMVQAHIEDDQQEKAINDFKRESMILSSLDHPAIPTIFDYFYDESECRFYLVMKYISGGDLAARIRSTPEGKIDEATVTEWALQIIDVLNYLHNQPSTIVYRDLKPSNIMIDGNSGRIMLIDFGIARSIGQKEEKGVTAVGTMGYAPPELFSGNVEPRSDIYSLGSTMFHLLTGADPQSNPLLIFDFQKNPRPRQINPRLSDQIERILMKSVEYSADARFASAADMRQVLEQHLANLRAGNVTYGVGEVPASVALDDQTVFCGFCGQRIVATDMFCAFCGSRQPIAQQGVHLAPAPKTTVTAKLLIEGTTELAMPAFALQKEENLLGRRDPMSNIFPEVDLSKYDPQTKISRRHARIWKQGDRFLVEDLGSSNGTLLAGGGAAAVRLTPHKPQLLASGDRIKLGDTTLYFVVD